MESFSGEILADQMENFGGEGLEGVDCCSCSEGEGGFFAGGGYDVEAQGGLGEI